MSLSTIIKFAIADDHKIFRDGIKMALTPRENLKLLWEAEDGKDLMHKMTIKKPDLILMDIRMPEIDGINAIEMLRKEYDNLKIIVVSMYDDQQMISKMMEMGANAYLTKTTDPDEIYEAIITCMNEEFYFNQLVNKAVMGKLMQKRNVKTQYGRELPVNFNEKELKILQLLGEDKTTDALGAYFIFHILPDGFNRSRAQENNF